MNKTIDELVKTIPSYPSLFFIFMLLSASTFMMTILNWIFGSVPYIGSYIAGGFFGLANLLLIILGSIVLFFIAWATSGVGRALLTLIYYLIIALFIPVYGWAIPVVLIAAKMLIKPKSSNGKRRKRRK